MVSDQPLANILPLLNKAIKPNIAYLLTSKQQANKNHHKTQADIMKRLGVKQVKTINIDNAFDLEEIQKKVQLIINQHQQDNILLNATGGTKPMSIAAYELCFSDNIDVFYLQGSNIIWLNPINKAPLPIESSLPLHNFLLAHQINIIDKDDTKISQTRQSLAKTWAGRGEKHTKIFATLNYYAAQANNNKLSAQVKPSDWETDLHYLLEELEHENMLNITQEHIKFTDENTRFFANGGWLEEHVFNTLLTLQQSHPEITSVARSVKIKLPLAKEPRHLKNKENNELDVIAIVNNQLWVFECKTKKMRSSNHNNQHNEDDSQHMIYKLAGLMKSLGGLRTKGCVVSFNQIADIHKTRAQLFDITCIDSKNIKDLKSKLAQLLIHSSHNS